MGRLCRIVRDQILDADQRCAGGGRLVNLLPRLTTICGAPDSIITASADNDSLIRWVERDGIVGAEAAEGDVILCGVFEMLPRESGVVADVNAGAIRFAVSAEIFVWIRTIVSPSLWPRE